MIATLDSDSTTDDGGNYTHFEHKVIITGVLNHTWAPFYTSKFENKIIPTHRIKNPFEANIFKSIRNKHNKKYPLQIYNITFKRQL